MFADLLIFALETIIIWDSKIFVIVSTFLKEINFVRSHPKVNIDSFLLLFFSFMAHFLHIFIHSLDGHIEFSDIAYLGMGLFQKGINNQFSGVDINIPEGLETSEVDFLEHNALK